MTSEGIFLFVCDSGILLSGVSVECNTVKEAFRRFHQRKGQYFVCGQISIGIERTREIAARNLKEHHVTNDVAQSSDGLSVHDVNGLLDRVSTMREQCLLGQSEF